MIALDTNVIVRFLTLDDAEQSRQASELIKSQSEQDKGFICREVLLELVWVLERAYGYSRSEIASAVNGILASTELVVKAAHDVGRTIKLYRSESFGFADLMIAAAARRSGAKELVSVDQRAVAHLNSPGRARGASHPSFKDR